MSYLWRDMAISAAIRKFALVLIMAGLAAGSAPKKPKTVIHVITVQWKASATPAQISQAITAAENISYPGLKDHLDKAD